MDLLPELTREQLEQRLAALHLASLELVQETTPEILLERLAELARVQVEAEYAAVGVLDEEGRLERFIPVGIPEDMLEQMPHPPRGLGLLGALMDSEETIRIRDIQKDPRSAGFPPGHPPMRSFLGVPIRHVGRQLGQIYLTNKRSAPAFSDDDQTIIETLASYAAAALANARLLDKLRRGESQLRRLVVLEERDRIGMDLHDGVIQDIYAVGLTLEHARLLLRENPAKAEERIAQAVDGLNNTIRDIRTYILDLRPRKLIEENLMDGLRRLVDEFSANSLVKTVLQGPADDQMLLPESAALTLFHICQETLANVGKHAHARHVKVTVWKTGGRALLEVEDDGRGFDTARASQTIGHGLANMHTRAEHAGGEIEITSEPGRGTTVLVWVPIPESVHPSE